MIRFLLQPWFNLLRPSFGGSSGPAPVAIPVSPPASLFPSLTQVLQGQGPGALGTATSSLEGIAGGLDVGSIYNSIVAASGREEATGRANIMASMGAGGMASSSDAMKATADYENQFQANLLKQLQTMQFQSEALKLSGAEGLMNTYANAAMAFAPTEEVMGTSAGPSIFSQVSSAATGGALAAAMLIMAHCWIAAELYGGWNSLEVYLLRSFLCSRRDIFGVSFVFLYIKFGQRVAAHIRTHPLSRRVVKFLFDWLLSRAYNWRFDLCRSQV